MNPPLAMLAELTHRCPLACPYCSNPVELARKEAERRPLSHEGPPHEVPDSSAP